MEELDSSTLNGEDKGVKETCVLCCNMYVYEELVM